MVTMKHVCAGLACLSLLSVFACSGGDLVLDPISSTRRTMVGGVPARSGDAYIVVDLNLQNNTSQKLLLVPPLFSVQTSDGLEFMGDPLTEVHPGGCKSSTSLAPGGTTRCSVVFSAPAKATTQLIAYTTEDSDDRYEASLKTSACSICDGECRDLSSSSNHCGACGVAVGAGECVDGKAVCKSNADTCGGQTCVDLRTSKEHCGECGNTVPPNASCIAGQVKCAVGFTDCNGVCADLTSDPSHCGQCGHQCPGQDPSCYNLQCN
ncbi:DUF4352 domain-containing protein [Polyangium jinanense]|uniref:DUF4352 domain-containing protein n=1 Tax=Polyangium jinanense TaxID=2829994 RepID=A0A9X4AXH5_9BACT|nr:DUF4352 domain-containing protein [Polyangium jinanense]MDC3961571.1 DUF4352 domain-containing protein [Polyangium jinanense]MDC3987936.1 DUF4352 domain-containing protein [Polyangium jinanense]